MIESITAIEHIKNNPSLYTGEEQSRYVLCYDGNRATISQVKTTVNYKIISELLHNAFDHVRKLSQIPSISIAAELYSEDDGINTYRYTITNSTNLDVFMSHKIEGKIEECNTLALILDTMYTSSNFKKSNNLEQSSTAGMYGIGLKVVVALASSVTIRLKTKKQIDTRRYENGILLDNSIESLESYHNTSHWNKISISILCSEIEPSIVFGLVYELMAFQKSIMKCSISYESNKYIIPSISLDDLLSIYSISECVSNNMNNNMNECVSNNMNGIEEVRRSVTFFGKTKDTIGRRETQSIMNINMTIQRSQDLIHGSLNSVLLVNGIRCTCGSWLSSLLKSIHVDYKKYYPDGSLTSEMLRSRIRIVAVATSNIPLEFNSNDKDKMTTKIISTSNISIPKEFLDPLQLQQIKKQAIKLMKDINLKKIRTYFPPSKSCQSLIILEGEGANTSMSYHIDRRTHGTFITTGKFPNADKGEHKILTSEPILVLKKILELGYKEIYLACDPDPDGYHIIGLLINYLSRIDGMLDRVRIIMFPLYKISSKGKKSKEVCYKYDLDGNESSSNIKYFKGLGSFSKDEIKDIIKDESYHLKLESITESKYYNIFKDFFVNSSQTRKRIYNKLDTNIPVSNLLESNIMTYHYLCIMMKRFMELAIVRTIPSIDGCNKTRRKIIFGASKFKGQQKVTVLGGKITELTDYAHGDKSLHDVITKMGQTYPCSQWINLMNDDGAFGSRRLKGDDAASARYLYTSLTDVAKFIYSDDYKDIIELSSEGEPMMYLPMFPLLLINGCLGIGVGFRTNIPPHDPQEVLEYMIAKNKDISYNTLPVPKFYKYKGVTIVEKKVEKNKKNKKNKNVVEVITCIGKAKIYCCIDRSTVEKTICVRVRIIDIPPSISIAKFVAWLVDNDYDFVDTSSPDYVDIEVYLDCIWDTTEGKIKKVIKRIDELENTKSYLNLLDLYRILKSRSTQVEEVEEYNEYESLNKLDKDYEDYEEKKKEYEDYEDVEYEREIDEIDEIDEYESISKIDEEIYDILISNKHFAKLYSHLVRRSSIECTILSDPDKKILSMSREELFSYFYERSIHYQKLLRKKKLDVLQASIDKELSMIWCITKLMAVKMKSINKEEYLRTLCVEEKHDFEFVEEVIDIDYRTSQLTQSYLNKLEHSIQESRDLKVVWSRPSKVLIEEYWNTIMNAYSIQKQ